ncbi:Hypothetical protein PP7435_CHR2-1990 [Komagataella phaffii CBS 7435]|uniref:Uncharacterized protein n=1 Tax=Komagataella phaffii (strain ATCC 76273 / CBS 7435 / CECT 11047 / NRRL Y-11430 / Wegner 21-1) TaxID=981350 RepID=A0A1G4KPU1_KOMPC|nr:Hypothetical protein BQ9382_C2-2818 [Komagataella phaffii CBS 7435]SCV12028.1 Hypothetical protein PP7435_CHR2-1990 [Komagataella phaffii CBS 7435]
MDWYRYFLARSVRAKRRTIADIQLYIQIIHKICPIILMVEIESQSFLTRTPYDIFPLMRSR